MEEFKGIDQEKLNQDLYTLRIAEDAAYWRYKTSPQTPLEWVVAIVMGVILLTLNAIFGIFGG